MTRGTKGLCGNKNSDPKGLSAPAPGLYTCIKTWKIMYKIRLQSYFLETCKGQGFSIDVRILSTKGCLPLPRGYIHMLKHYKMCIKSEFKEICLKLAINGRSDKGFLLTAKVCPQGVFSPCPGAIYMYKIIKNVYKIRFWRDHFVPNGLSAPARGYIHNGETWKKKMYKKSDFKAIFFSTGNKWAKW